MRREKTAFEKGVATYLIIIFALLCVALGYHIFRTANKRNAKSIAEPEIVFSVK